MTNLMNAHTKALVEVAKIYFSQETRFEAGHEFTDEDIARGIYRVARENRFFLTDADQGQARNYFHQTLPTPSANKIQEEH